MAGAIALIALGVGYLVFVTASKEKEGVKLLGQVIGIFVMIASLLCLICSSMKCVGKSGYGKGGYDRSCSMKLAKDNCPIQAAAGDAVSR
ncbi:MAG: hypothetical protein MOGMAGMI_01672 [Candidatus Omnitrophica bacterium]|nr:hypothetical protein [Candidatus Omnitrophota bacterium]